MHDMENGVNGLASNTKKVKQDMVILSVDRHTNTA